MSASDPKRTSPPRSEGLAGSESDIAEQQDGDAVSTPIVLRNRRGVAMSGAELAEAYRANAAKCIEIAHKSSEPEIKLALLGMAQSWRSLAEQALKNAETVLVYETPTTDRSSRTIARRR